MKIKGFKLGATGQYTHGKLNLDDEGELRMAVATDFGESIIRIEFGKPVGWLGLPALQARELGNLLIKKADELDKHKF